MSEGRIIGVVGPSGVGKDSVMFALTQADPSWRIARRVITRPPQPGGEDHDAVTQDAFDQLLAQGAFCLSWRAHGLSYGIPAGIGARMSGGEKVLVNLSRKVLDQARELWPALVVLRLHAQPEILARRLSARGRESTGEVRARLAREDVELSPDLAIFDISNDGPLEQTVAQALAALTAVRA